MLLQTRGRMTARQLSAELEVSERTIYRDLTALNSAGIPVYMERGPGGGCELLEDYRTDLTGLTRSEALALLLLDVPAALADLGMRDQLRLALLKLAAATPQASRQEAERLRARFILDTDLQPSFAPAPAPHLMTIYAALLADRCLRLTYRSDMLGIVFQRRVEPLGLVAQGNDWLLVGRRARVLRVYRLNQVLEVESLAEMFARPPDFDLKQFWVEWKERSAARPAYAVRLRLESRLIPLLPLFTGAPVQIREQSAPGEDGKLELTLLFGSLEEARSRLLALGGAAEVLSPQPLRLSLADYARQVVQVYEPPDEIEKPQV